MYIHIHIDIDTHIGFKKRLRTSNWETSNSASKCCRAGTWLYFHQLYLQAKPLISRATLNFTLWLDLC